MGRILAWDLETTNLKGNMGHILCAAAKWIVDGEPENKFALSMRIDQLPGYGTTPHSYLNDKPIVQGMIELITEADAQVAHYGERFDQPFLYTRAIMWGLKIPPPVKLIDTWKYSRKWLALTSNRLDTISHTLRCKHLKYKMPLESWVLAMHGHKPTLRDMQKYNENDVDTVIDTYLRMRQLIHDHPNTSMSRGGKACFACGSKRLQARGWYLTKSFRTARFQCQECGTWNRGKQEKI